MSARHIVDEILLNYSRQTGLSGLKLVDNQLGLAFDDTLKVYLILHPESEVLQLEAEIVDLQTMNSDLYRSFLAFNYHWDEYQLFFSLDNHRNKLCLNRLLTVGQLDYELFEVALAELLKQSESWESLLTAQISSEPVPFESHISDLRV